MVRGTVILLVLVAAAGTADAGGGHRGPGRLSRVRRAITLRPPGPAEVTSESVSPRAARDGALASVLGRGNPESPRSFAALRTALATSMAPAEWRTFARGVAWKPYPLRERWVGEEHAGFVSKGKPRRQMAYLGRRERARYKVTIGRDGLLRDARGKLFSCGPNSVLVADQHGNLYARDAGAIATEAEDPSKLAFAHSSFLAGQPVAMSVEVEVAEGKLKHAKNRSGHYRPSRKNFVSWLVGLESRGLDTSELSVSFDFQSTIED